MPERSARAHWEVPVTNATGRSRSRVAWWRWSTPSAHAGCFTLALALGLTVAGHPPTRFGTPARVGIEKGSDVFRIPSTELHTEAEVPGLDAAPFEKPAESAKSNCPVSRALAGTEIRLEPKLV
jgi:lipoyl-dependent peroxiredoxin